MLNKDSDKFLALHSSGTVNGEPYLVLDLLGKSLDDVIKEAKEVFSLKCCCLIGLQMTDIIEKFHEIGYVHLDIKPENILIESDDKNDPRNSKLHLIDFGICKKYLDENGDHIK